MPKTEERTFSDLSVGDTAEFELSITPKLVDEFARVSGDYNPLHTDEEYASTTVFKNRIAHGALIGALFSRLLGMQLPGLHTLFLSQTLEFKKPVLLGTTLTIRGTISEKNDANHTVTIKLKALDPDKTYVSGHAVVFVSA